jgi:endonuclease-3
MRRNAAAPNAPGPSPSPPEPGPSPDVATGVRALIAALRHAYPEAACALTHEDPFQLLVATILSAQCTDARVNMVTPVLFAAFPDANAMSRASQEELETIVRSTGFYRNKAKSIRAASARIVESFGGRVPDNMEDLRTLPGVARKTANVVLGVGYGIADGVVVDTHVERLSRRLGLSRGRNPEEIEQDLMRLVPRDEWIVLSHLLIFHGRQVCQARKPACDRCPVASLCPSAPFYLAGKEPPMNRPAAAAKRPVKPRKVVKAATKARPKAASKPKAKSKPASKAKASAGVLQRSARATSGKKK